MSPVGSESRIASSGRLVERVERGESAGTVVWKLSRFSRSLLDAVETTKRITDAGGRLIAEDFDSKQSMSKALLGLMAGLAEEELEPDAKAGGRLGLAPSSAASRTVKRRSGTRRGPTDGSRSSRRMLPRRRPIRFPISRPVPGRAAQACPAR
jgi:hypothetical protein